MAGLFARSLSGLPEVRAGDDLAALIVDALAREHEQPSGREQLFGHEQPSGPLHDEQVVVIAHKVVSKAEGAVVALGDVTPGARARELAAKQDKDRSEIGRRTVQVVLDQSAEILRAANGVLISRTHHGFVCANAGVDASNAAREGGATAAGIGAGETLILLPRDPDASARALRARLRELTGASPAVLITDSFGRAWRHGQCDVAIGCAGMSPLDDWRGRTDSVGRELHATWLAVADGAAATADLARAKDSREPVVLIDGLERFITAADGPGAAALLRPLAEDLFR
ncbi:MAG TPA: coenzyme F420-0:L-glutamate ligase [Solirubrobacteraceae bacterium]